MGTLLDFASSIKRQKNCSKSKRKEQRSHSEMMAVSYKLILVGLVMIGIMTSSSTAMFCKEKSLCPKTPVCKGRGGMKLQPSKADPSCLCPVFVCAKGLKHAPRF